jgi:hypothetical protein
MDQKNRNQQEKRFNKGTKKSECFAWEKGKPRGPSFHILRSLGNSVTLVLGTKTNMEGASRATLLLYKIRQESGRGRP